MIGKAARLPVIRILLPLLAGILTVIQGIGWHEFPFWPLCGITISGFLVSQWISNRTMRRQWLPGLWLIIFFYITGFQLTLNTIEKWDPTHFTHLSTDSSKLVVRVTEPPSTKSQSIHFTGQIAKVLTREQEIEAKGKAWVYLSKSQQAKTVEYGDLLFCKNGFRKLEPPPNPEQFNLKAFLANQQIYHQAFLDSNEWTFTGQTEGNPLFSLIYEFKGQVKKWLNKAITRPAELDVANALVLGEKSNIDPELRQAYAGTGAMHVLAVSGLHVGIIYMILNYAFSFLNLLPKGRLVKILLIIGLLWLYALLTGLSPSVFRAATMFTFVTVGQNLKRYTNVFSSIMASMLVLLVYDPFLITQVGFQLSYAAVIGIVVLQPRIYNLLPQSRYWLIDQTWALTAVSIAAQLATFPLTLFYFNMFPSYFLLSNLVVIPAAFLIVTTGFLFMVIHTLNLALLEYGIDLVLDWLLWGLNKSIFWVQDLPMAVINELYIGTPVLILLYGMIISGTLVFVQRSKFALFATALFIAAWLGLNNYQHLEQHHRQKLALLKAGQHSLVNVVTPDQVLMFGQKEILQNEEQLKFHTYRYFWKNGLSKKDLNKYPLDSLQSTTLFADHGITASFPLLQVQDFKLALIQSGSRIPDLKPAMKVDAVVLMNNPKVKIKDIAKAFETDQIIAGAATAPWHSDDWREACQKKGLSFHNMSKAGALVENL